MTAEHHATRNIAACRNGPNPPKRHSSKSDKMPLWILFRRLVLSKRSDVTDLHNDEVQRRRFREEACTDVGRRPEYRLEYIKQIIDVIKEDIKHVFLNISFCIGAMALLMAQSELRAQPSEPTSIKVVYFLSLLFFFASTALYFSYLRALHVLHMRIARNILALDIFRVRELYAGELGVWRYHGWKYVSGRAAMLVAMSGLGYMVFARLFPQLIAM